MKSTREKILHTLLTKPKSSIYDLAAAVEINAVSVRHHVSSLMAENLVTVQEERHGIGRPRLLYSLTENGVELFPTRYIKLVSHLLQEMKSALSEQEMQKLLSKIAVEISEKHALSIQKMPIEAKLEASKTFLAQEGIIIEWEKNGAVYVINEVACPFYHISQQHPEVCVIDQTIFSTLLSSPVTKTKCILTGDPHCSYVIQHSVPKEK